MHQFGDPRLPERFWNKVQVRKDGCWGWTASTTSHGYAQWHGCGQVTAHRASYSMLVGPIPEGLVIDHVCRNRSCVNPGHLEPVTVQENILRGMLPYVNIDRGRAVTECAKGHPFDEANTRMTKAGRRVCRTCAAAWDKTKRERAKAGDIRPPGRPSTA